jgi:hypothetical protein
MPVTASDGIHDTDVTDDSMRIAGFPSDIRRDTQR